MDVRVGTLGKYHFVRLDSGGQSGERVPRHLRAKRSGCGAYCPDLPGLGVVGETREEVDRLIREAIIVHIESLREHGEPVPEPTSAGTVEAPVA
jgi:predicted RNase H-like HicB family nuclease